MTSTIINNTTPDETLLALLKKENRAAFNQGEWVTHGVLWTPSGISHYINGKLIKTYDNKTHIFSPNHFMNILLGCYGKGGFVRMEVDYIRGYQWPLEGNNELPNPGFEYSDTSILPWEGNGTISYSEKKSGHNSLKLLPGQDIYQYVYLNSTSNYRLNYWYKGRSVLKANIENVAPVSGELSGNKEATGKEHNLFGSTYLNFTTLPDYPGNKKTIKITFTNKGKTVIYLDDIIIEKRK